MQQVTPWLSRASFEKRLILPANFNLAVFDPFILDLEESQLPGLLGSGRLMSLIEWIKRNPKGEYTPDSESETYLLDEALSDLYAKTIPFLVYAVYAEYIFSGEVQATDTGPVTKSRDSSTALTDTQRTQLYKNYRDKANNRAAQLETYVRSLGTTSCVALSSNFGTQFSSSRGRTGSIIDNL